MYNPYTTSSSATSGLNGYKPATTTSTPSYGVGTTPYSYGGATTTLNNPYATATATSGSGYPTTTTTGAGSFSNLGAPASSNYPSSNTNLAMQSQPIVQNDEEEPNANFHTLIEKRQREADKVPFEGEPYDCLKHLTQQQIDEYAKRGINDYLNCLRLSTKQELISKYQRTLETCRVQANGDRNYNFVDEEFPPNLSSLVGSNQANRTSWKALKWYRPKDMTGYSDFRLFVGNIEPNDIRQGYLGDCYFLSSIASLAENPERIKRLFEKDIEDRERNPYGCHCVKICDKGEWREVIVDENFPCISKQRGPSFTKGNGAEIWVMLLEKAWAKINGSYDQIEAGLTRECLHDFTGAPTQTYWLDEPSQYKEVWEKLLLGEANNYAMTCGSTDAETKDALDKVGLISGHAYSLLAAYEVNFQGQPTKLVKLRNPWGEKEWSGDWCDEHPNFKFLSAQDKQKIELHDRAENDGIFFMTYDDFRTYFTDVQICFVHDNYQYFSIRANSNSKQGKFFKVKITKEGRYFFTINQKSKRKYPKEQQKDFKYSTATLIIAKQEANGAFTYIDGKQREDREVWTGENQRVYKPGTYIVYAKVQWRGKENDEFVLSSYGESTPAFTEITKVEAQNVISEAYFSHAVQQHVEDERLKRSSKRKVLVDNKSWVHLNQTEDGFFYLAIENKSEKVLHGEFKFTKMGGLKLKTPFSGQSVKVFLEPGQHTCAILRVKDYKTLTGLSLSQTIQFK